MIGEGPERRTLFRSLLERTVGGSHLSFNGTLRGTTRGKAWCSPGLFKMRLTEELDTGLDRKTSHQPQRDSVLLASGKGTAESLYGDSSL